VTVHKVGACLRLVRPVNSLMVGFAVLVGIALALPGNVWSIRPLAAITGFLVGFTISASSMILNDIADIEIDKVNAPNRPLPSGEISLKTAWICYFILISLGIAFSEVGGLDSMAVVVLAIVASVLYNLRLKLAGFPGNISVAFLTSLPFLYAFTLIDSPNPTVLVFWAMVFLTVLGREIAKDIADVEGDSIKGAKTLPILYGRRAAAAVASVFYIAAVALSPLPIIAGLVLKPYLYTAGVLIVDILLLYSVVMLVRSPRKMTVMRHKSIVLTAMLIGLIVFLVSSL